MRNGVRIAVVAIVLVAVPAVAFVAGKSQPGHPAPRAYHPRPPVAHQTAPSEAI